MQAVKICFVAVLLVIFSANLNIAFASENLLLNPDLEDFSSNSPSNWTKNVSTLAVSESSNDYHSGSKSVLFQSSSSSTKYLYQILPINPGQPYHFSGWSKTVSGSGNSYLRVTQCSDSECKSEIKSDDSSHAVSSDWKELTIDFTSDSDAKAAKIKVSLDPSGSEAASNLWDDLSLALSSTNPPPTPTPSQSPSPPPPSSSSSTKPKVNFDFSPPANLVAGEQFNLPIKITNLDSVSYYLKIRIGPDDSHLTSGQTYNSNWFDDNDSWSKFPQISGPSWQASITARLPSDEKRGNYKIAVRVKKVESDSYHESDTQEAQFKSAPTLSPTTKSPSPAPQSAKTPTSQPVRSPTNLAETLGETSTESSFSSDEDILGISTLSGTNESAFEDEAPQKLSPVKVLSQYENLFPVRDTLISCGLFLTGFALTVFLRDRKSRL